MARASLFTQQCAAYPMLDESDDFLFLCDFESPNQLDHFQLVRRSGGVNGPNPAYSTSPTATGIGAVGIDLVALDVTSLIFTPNIKNWQDNNLFQLSLFSQRDQITCTLQITGAKGNTYRRTCLLHAGWNIMQIDLTDASRLIDLRRVKKVVFEFRSAAGASVWLDDLLLMNHHKVLVGTVGGEPGTVYAVKEAKRFRIGANRRFELVFAGGKIIAWYDLSTDPERTANLAGDRGFGPFLYELSPSGDRRAVPFEQTVPSVHSRVLSKEGASKVKLVADVFFDSSPHVSDPPDQTLLYAISADGSITMELSLSVSAKRLAAEFALAGGRGFDPIIGRIRNAYGPPEAKIEYALARRIGAKPGADLLLAFRPWKAAYLPVTCRLAGGTQTDPVRIVFESDSEQGENYLVGMMRVWPTDIDHIGNAEQYVREFLSDTPHAPIEAAPRPHKSDWSPSWSVKE